MGRFGVIRLLRYGFPWGICARFSAFLFVSPTGAGIGCGRLDAMQEAPRLGRLDVLLVRHAEPIPPGTPGWEERDDERPLTEEGRRAAEQLADELEPYVITSAYSSPYPRAIETVTPTAQRRGLEVHLLPDLRERRLTLQPAV